MNDWSEFKTAMIVAKLGSISAAASALSVHRATVSRHLDVVESTLGTTLFVRHPRGVELTEAGMEMLTVTQNVQHLFDALKGRLRNAQVDQSGELIVTALWGVMPLIMPAVKSFNERHPRVSVKFVCGEENLRLEYGEAHVAVRAGSEPTDLDYVVRRAPPIRFSPYIEKAALFELESTSDFESWKDLPFIWLMDSDGQPLASWVKPDMKDQGAALLVNTPAAVLPAVLAGVGVGYLPRHIGAQYDQLVELDPLNDDQSMPLWVISHRDLTKTPIVREFIQQIMQTTGDENQT
ncbi:MAG: LysR family transcriptional regulator [Planctomycetota bacterium]